MLSQKTLEILFNAGYKNIKREPTGDPKKPWRYYYQETSQAKEVKKENRNKETIDIEKS